MGSEAFADHAPEGPVTESQCKELLSLADAHFRWAQDHDTVPNLVALGFGIVHAASERWISSGSLKVLQAHQWGLDDFNKCNNP